MKKSIIIFTIAFLLAGCDDFVDLSPVSQRNVEDFYQSESDIRIAVNGIYAGFQSMGTFGQGYWLLFEMRSDNTDQGPDVTGLAAQLAAINDFNEIATSDMITDAYSDTYRVIQRANVVLERIDDIEMSAEARDQYKGEALFLRSLAYYYLAIAFGNVPLYLQETTSANDPVEQVSQNDILNHIAGDLADAEDLLPVSYSGSDVGRATKGAAATLLGRVLLTLERPGQAEDPLRRVVQDYGYEMLDNYEDLWGPDVGHHSETIFAIDFASGGHGTGSPFSNQFSPSNALQTGVGQARNRPTQNMWEAYEEDDVRRDISMATTYVNTDGDIVEALHILKYQSDPPSQFDADNNWYVFRLPDAMLMLAEALGESTESYGLINDVRDRAGLDPVLPVDLPIIGLGFEEVLMRERRAELAFENHRWPDLLRFGVAQQVMQDKGYTPRRLFPIPQREIDVRPGEMEQNDLGF